MRLVKLERTLDQTIDLELRNVYHDKQTIAKKIKELNAQVVSQGPQPLVLIPDNCLDNLCISKAQDIHYKLSRLRPDQKMYLYNNYKDVNDMLEGLITYGINSFEDFFIDSNLDVLNDSALINDLISKGNQVVYDFVHDSLSSSQYMNKGINVTGELLDVFKGVLLNIEKGFTGLSIAYNFRGSGQELLNNGASDSFKDKYASEAGSFLGGTLGGVAAAVSCSGSAICIPIAVAYCLIGANSGKKITESLRMISNEMNILEAKWSKAKKVYVREIFQNSTRRTR